MPSDWLAPNRLPSCAHSASHALLTLTFATLCLANAQAADPGSGSWQGRYLAASQSKQDHAVWVTVQQSPPADVQGFAWRGCRGFRPGPVWQVETRPAIGPARNRARQISRQISRHTGRQTGQRAAWRSGVRPRACALAAAEISWQRRTRAWQWVPSRVFAPRASADGCHRPTAMDWVRVCAQPENSGLQL